MIVVKNLKKSFGDNNVLDGVSFSVEKGETVAVIGPSGSGKSTMLRCLINLEQAESGTIIIEDAPLLVDGKYVNEKDARLACMKMGMVFQNFNLFPHLTVMGNLTCAPLELRKMTKSEAEKRAKELLKKVGLSEKADDYPSMLSGGQKQRVAIARALMMDPEMLLFDEPTSSLDPQLTAEVLAVMRQLAQDRMTMIVVTHEMGFAREVADKILFMCDREIIGEGTPKDIFENPEDLRIKEFIDSILK
ncbi:MAG: amino acid ABC transporter ATP-binding protein [Clostridiales bacterium]|nr:amino acid ABC transporter ATP-binding protein [Clostridiales bacterium]